MTEEYELTTRRRFMADFKARVALEALRCDKTAQEIAAKHRVHPNQVSGWKRRAIDGLGEVICNGDRVREEREAEIRLFRSADASWSANQGDL